MNFDHIGMINLKFVRPEGASYRNKEVVPEYDSIREYLIDALGYCEKNNIRFRLECIPLCLIKGYEHECMEMRELICDSQF